MTLTGYILIAIPICILTILIWTYFDYKKYKREHHLIIIFSLLFPTLSHAQYIDNENCRITFRSHENHQGKLEHIKNNVLYRFIPSSSAWKLIVRNNSNEVVQLNWEKANFIINGRASSVSLSPFTTDKVPMEIIKDNHEINRTITASNLITEKGINKIYNKRNIRKGERTYVSIVLPITIGNKPQFFHTFNFTVTQAN
ncbi:MULTISPECIES: hypothetical protein [Bacteroides]|uniref:hypothetical protein n=1 Tax=Bacteroides TaxID=816 RepID=UPI000E44B698|nr:MULTISPECIES: hypothetical protein [Bacteroides]MBS7575036.1 hypothetical protein [Bacteroides propionicigenes]RGM29850.1 hypothetical protein DXC20_02775 [Bacteroides sp. OM08-17BH]HBO05075.1 hypothetical protein [Bacteroides sp.]